MHSVPTAVGIGTRFITEGLIRDIVWFLFHGLKHIPVRQTGM